ncbi:hypothetical protein M2408_001004 [Sphingobacterium sp. BIGb0165]|nr:hypothetical protein [Sphingobacterium sp. BIGb0165]
MAFHRCIELVFPVWVTGLTCYLFTLNEFYFVKFFVLNQFIRI